MQGYNNTSVDIESITKYLITNIYISCPPNINETRIPAYIQLDSVYHSASWEHSLIWSIFGSVKRLRTFLTNLHEYPRVTKNSKTTL